MNICIAGSRGFKNKQLVVAWMETNFFKDEDILINGNCQDGVDAWALREAQLHGFKLQVYDPDWQRWGKRGGVVRNEEMVRDADKVVCFWDGVSPGTKSTIDFALKYQKDLEVIFA